MTAVWRFAGIGHDLTLGVQLSKPDRSHSAVQREAAPEGFKALVEL